MRISIIVPIYNSEAHLNECLGSLFSQTYKNLEAICVDDGSTDSSEQVVTGRAGPRPGCS